jgi:hypothetical protein
VSRLSEFVTREEVDGERVGDGARGGVELREDRVGGGGHEGVNEGGDEVDEVEGEEDDFSATSRVRLEEGVVETVVLDELVTASGDLEEGHETTADLLMVHLVDEGREEGVDVVDETLVLLGELVRRSGEVDAAVLRVGDGRVELGNGELERTVDEVAQVVEELGVGLRNEVVPGELGVVCLGTVLEEVVAPDGGGNARFPSVLTENSDVLRLRELGALVLQVFCEE